MRKRFSLKKKKNSLFPPAGIGGKRNWEENAAGEEPKKKRKGMKSRVHSEKERNK